MLILLALLISVAFVYAVMVICWDLTVLISYITNGPEPEIGFWPLIITGFIAPYICFYVTDFEAFEKKLLRYI